MKVTVDNLEFVIAYIQKHIDSAINDDLEGMSFSNKFAFFKDYELDDEVYKRMMTAYRVDKKRKLDKGAGNGLVTICITNESHAKLKSIANSYGVTLSHCIEMIGTGAAIKADKELERDLESLISQLDAQKIQNDYLKTEIELLKRPQQTWAFSEEDLQEQSKLIEKLTTENHRINAELQLLKKTASSNAGLEIWGLKNKVNELTKQLEMSEFRKHSESILNQTLLEEIDDYKTRIAGLEFQLQHIEDDKQCQGATALGEQCKRKNDLQSIDGLLLCNVHKSLHDQGKLKVFK